MTRKLVLDGWWGVLLVDEIHKPIRIGYVPFSCRDVFKYRRDGLIISGTFKCTLKNYIRLCKYVPSVSLNEMNETSFKF